MSSLKGKVAIVTRRVEGHRSRNSRALAQAGASVAVNYVSSKEGADRVVADIAAKGGRAIAVKGDVGKAEDVKAIFEETNKAFARLISS